MTTGFKTQYFHELAQLEERNFWFHARNRIIVWAVARYLPSLTSFLEIGCGTGFVIAGLAKRFPGARFLGSEYLEEGLEYARRRTPDAEFRQMDARHIPYESAMEAIGIFDVLEHIDEDMVVLQQIYQALRPGGFLFVTVPQHRWLWSAVDAYACHIRRYDAEELHQKVSSAGFTIAHSTSFVTALLPVMYLSRRLSRNKREMKTDEIAGLRVNPVLNTILERLLLVELALIRAGISLPFGGSRLVIAQKPV